MFTEQLSLEIMPSPAQEWEQEAVRRALDGLFSLARKYNSSLAYMELMKFTAKFRFYAPFNALLVHIQMPGATFVAPPDRWLYCYGRTIKPDARPLVILQPMGPVMFVFDVSETEPMNGAPDLPPDVLHPFGTTGRDVSHELERIRDNAVRDGIEIYTQEAGAQYAGSICSIETDRRLMFQVKQRPKPEYIPVKVCYAIMLNRDHPSTTCYASLVHELAHLYCGHLGTPNVSADNVPGTPQANPLDRFVVRRAGDVP